MPSDFFKCDMSKHSEINDIKYQIKRVTKITACMTGTNQVFTDLFEINVAQQEISMLEPTILLFLCRGKGKNHQNDGCEHEGVEFINAL